jgi:hypothetical protein
MHYRLPPELFDGIIKSYTTIGGPGVNPALAVQMTKRELGACSLTCRFWARKCRPQILSFISLRSHEDFKQLLHLIDSAMEIEDIPSLAQCIEEIEVIHSGPWAVPWFHRIHRELTARDVDLDPDRISLEIKGAYVPESVRSSETQSNEAQPNDAETKGYAPRSLSTSLPRTLPRSLYSHGRLDLSDMRIRTVKDMLRLIDTQADLSFIAWKRLTFDEGATVPPPRTRTRRVWGGMETVSMSEWTNIELEMRIMFLLASEKVPETLAVPADLWDNMLKATIALVFPRTHWLVLGLRGEGEPFQTR